MYYTYYYCKGENIKIMKCFLSDHNQWMRAAHGPIASQVSKFQTKLSVTESFFKQAPRESREPIISLGHHNSCHPIIIIRKSPHEICSSPKKIQGTLISKMRSTYTIKFYIIGQKIRRWWAVFSPAIWSAQVCDINCAESLGLFNNKNEIMTLDGINYF